ncbi:hypothetical protein FB451DRAFT_441302 [Mycena latifolia]|nr:hypothetical protein FB451DRAFT_441302 [Mycena latifolia]
MSLNEFSPELLGKIFLNLPYQSLLSVLAVSVQWNEIVVKDPALSVQMFKRLSKVYVEPGCCEPANRRYRDETLEESEPIRLHPALPEISYIMGNDISSVRFYAADHDIRLVNLAIANDFISIPVVTMVKIELPDRPGLAHGFKIKVKNSKGVKLIDLFKGMEAESNREVMTAEYGVMTKADLLGDHLYYEGLSTVVRTGLGLSAQLWLGS